MMSPLRMLLRRIHVVCLLVCLAVVTWVDPTPAELVSYYDFDDGATVTEEEIVEHVRTRWARFKAPKRVVFTELPKTSTGKIQKFVLREQAASL